MEEVWFSPLSLVSLLYLVLPSGTHENRPKREWEGSRSNKLPVAGPERPSAREKTNKQTDGEVHAVTLKSLNASIIIGLKKDIENNWEFLQFECT